MTENEGTPGGDSGGPEMSDEDLTSVRQEWHRDAYIGERIADQNLVDRFVFTKGLGGWLKFDGRRWRQIDEGIVFDVIRLALIELHRTRAKEGAGSDELKQISALLSTNRIRAILVVARGCVTTEPEKFDAHPDLLNCGNGVVDLRTGELGPHDPEFMLTKVTMVDYVPDACHPDWQKSLEALPDADAAHWLQARLGQAITGHTVPDDVMVILKGSGENGKTTIVLGAQTALGNEYAVTLPDRVLLARTGDHPTELMTLRGARLAVSEELPELRHLNVKRLKDLHGVGEMSARYCGRDTVTWKPTHSAFATTNYLPRVNESDHGTWRRLALVDFPYRYRKPGEPIENANDRQGDPGLRERIKAGDDKQHEAILAWLVKGAQRWYRNNRVMPQLPESVRKSTDAWRGSADLLLRYINDRLVFDTESHIRAKELFEDFSEWLKESGHIAWSEQNFSERLAQHEFASNHGVVKRKGIRESRGGLSRRTTEVFGWVPPPAQYPAWLGVRFRTKEDETENDDDQG
jgi:P4 family phage/plasmid primase-like protien